MGERLAGVTAGRVLLWAAVGACALWVKPAVGGAEPAADRWVEVRSQHFVVLTDGGEKQGRRVAGQFERMRAVFRRLLPAAGDDADPPIEVLAVKDRKGMQALEPEAYLGKGRVDLGGLFLWGADRNMILVRLDGIETHAFSTVYHEYTHYMLRKTSAWLPLWLNEGLAQYYENTDIDDKGARLGQASPEMLGYLGQNGMLPLGTLLAVDTSSPYYHEEEKGSVFYAESWALTHYLIVSDREAGTHRLHDYTLLVAQGEDPVSAGETAFGGLVAMQRALSMYVQQRNFTYFTMRADLGVKESSFEARAVPGAEADAVRADALIFSGRTNDAEALLEGALRDGPECAAAHEAMGFLKYREGDLEGARKWYGEAVRLDANSYLAQYYFGSLSMQAGERGQGGRADGGRGGVDDEAIEASLRAAMRLNANFAPAYDALATFYGMRHERLDEAQTLSARAIELEPESLNYRLDRANVLAEERLYASALGDLKAAERLAKTPAETAEVERRIKRLEERQAR